MNIQRIIIAILLLWPVYSCNVREVEGKSASENSADVPSAYAAAENQNTDKSSLEGCKETVLELLTTSPAFKQKTAGLHEAIVKNGGTSFGITIESSPEEELGTIQYSAEYIFSLEERYPDRNVAIARYMFDPAQQQLYEYDASDQLIAIAFDQSLLAKVKNVCK